MTDRHALPSMWRAAAAITRRGSLLTLGGTVLAAAIPGPSLVEAKKKGKNARRCKRKNEENENGQCEQQLPPCRDFVDDFCALFNPPGPARDACIVGGIVCCEPIMRCDGEGFFECLLQRIQSI